MYVISPVTARPISAHTKICQAAIARVPTMTPAPNSPDEANQKPTADSTPATIMPR